MQRLAELRCAQGVITLGYDFDASFQALAARGEVDAFIVSTEDGFSPLGGAMSYFSADLGIPADEIKRFADWNRFTNDSVTVVCLQSRRRDGALKGLILAPGETARCYQQFATPLYGRPYRDFYYNVTYEAIAFACSCWGARRLATSHLSGCGKFHADIATCQAEALAHFGDGPSQAHLDSFLFVGCCIRMDHLDGIRRLNAEGSVTHHRSIATRMETRGDAKLLSLNWKVTT